MRIIHNIFIYFTILFTASLSYSQIIGASSSEPTLISAGQEIIKYDIQKILLFNTNNVLPNIKQGKSVLTANLIIYDNKNEIGYAYDHVVYENKKDQVILKSGEGTYETKKKEVLAKVNPIIYFNKDKTIAKSDLIKIYPDRDYTIFIRNVWITNQKNLLTGDYATYMQKIGQFIITGNASALQEGTLLNADKIDMYTKNGELDNYTATGNVKAVDKKQGYTLLSGRLDYYKDLGYSRMTKNPVILFEDRNIKAYSIVMEKFDKEDKANLLGDVVIIQNDRKAYGKWGVYYTKIKKIILTGNPVLIQNNTRFYSHKITVDVESETMTMSGKGSGAFERQTN